MRVIAREKTVEGNNDVLSTCDNVLDIYCVFDARKQGESSSTPYGNQTILHPSIDPAHTKYAKLNHKNPEVKLNIQ